MAAFDLESHGDCETKDSDNGVIPCHASGVTTSLGCGIGILLYGSGWICASHLYGAIIIYNAIAIACSSSLCGSCMNWAGHGRCRRHDLGSHGNGHLRFSSRQSTVNLHLPGLDLPEF